MFLSKSFQRNISCLVFCCYICIKLKVLWYKKNHTIKDLHKTNKTNESKALNQTGTQISAARHAVWTLDGSNGDGSLSLHRPVSCSPAHCGQINNTNTINVPVHCTLGHTGPHWATLGQVLATRVSTLGDGLGQSMYFMKVIQNQNSRRALHARLVVWFVS